jgi:hypothetical protein
MEELMKTTSLEKDAKNQNRQESVEKLIKQISEKDPSVRTTFALTKDGDTALAWIIEHSNKSIKSVIDNICEELQKTINTVNDGPLESIIIELIRGTPKSSDDNIRRSMVLSKRSLKILNGVAKKHKISRNALLDKGFCLMMKLLENSSGVRLEKHKKALSIINKLWGDAEKVEKKLQEFLDDEDPILCGLGYAIVHLMNTSSAIEEEQKDGTPIDPDKI